MVELELKKGMYQNYCALHEDLEKLFGKKVDLIEKSVFDYKFKNPNVKSYKEKVTEEILGSAVYV